jgi:hypothetical protein
VFSGGDGVKRSSEERPRETNVNYFDSAFTFFLVYRMERGLGVSGGTGGGAVHALWANMGASLFLASTRLDHDGDDGDDGEQV